MNRLVSFLWILAVSTLLVWITRIYNLLNDNEISSGERIWSVLVAFIFLLAAAAGAAGGVGLSAVELGKAMGARVIAAASSEEKIKICLEHGADEAFVYPSGNLDRDQQKELSNKIKELTDTHTDIRHRTDTASSHSEGFLRNLHKKYL